MADVDLTPFIAIAIQELPAILGFIKDAHARQNPDAPAMSDAEAQAALSAAVESSIAKDDQWLAAHPEI